MANYTGNDANNTYNGTGSADRILGLVGNDSLSGGEGNDCIRGGQGVDRLTGGSGNDRFTYDALSESPGSGQQFDYIHDFVPGQDKIDLRKIDAAPGLAWPVIRRSTSWAKVCRCPGSPARSGSTLAAA